MKKIKLLFLSIAILLSGKMISQVSVNVNIGSPPLWGPVGYSDVRFYYLPDVEAYYDVQTSMFIYYGGGIWLHKPHLPQIYSSYDLYGGYKVVMSDYRGETPYTNFNEHKRKYAKGFKGPAQKTIGEKPGKRNSKAHEPSNGPSHTQTKQSGRSTENNSNSQQSKRSSASPNGNQHTNSGQNHGGNGKKK
jgi:hypothetical protein